MIYHKKCGNNVYLDIGGHVIIVVTYGILKTSLKVSRGDIIITEDKFPSEFICTDCGEKQIKPEDLFTICMNCGNQLEIKDTLRPSQSNGLYCKECIKKFIDSGESFSQLSKIIKEVVLKL